MRKLFCAICVMATLAAFTACEETDSWTKGKFVFTNDSSFTVTVTPNGQKGWYQFMIGSGQKRTIEISDDEIYFRYSPSNRVEADTSRKGKIRFYNR